MAGLRKGSMGRRVAHHDECSGTCTVAERPTKHEPPPDSRTSRPVSFEDVQLVKMVQGGQSEAYGELVRRYEDRLFNTCWRICGNLEDARDVTQEAFMVALSKIDGFRRHSTFYTWIFRIAVNLALSHKRKAKSRRVVSLDQALDAGGSQAETLAQRVRDMKAANPSEASECSEAQGNVVRALNELDDDYRAVVVLRDIEGFDYHEIATILEVPIGTVKSRIHRGRNALREALLPLNRQER